jgi:hypothetical protein
MEHRDQAALPTAQNASPSFRDGVIVSGVPVPIASLCQPVGSGRGWRRAEPTAAGSRAAAPTARTPQPQFSGLDTS